MKKDDCIFCRIAGGEIPTNTVYEDRRFRAILDNGPATKGHTLIIPKEHYQDLFELPEDTASEAVLLAKRLAERMVERLNCDGVNLVQNNGVTAGQTVMHFHLHVIPRYGNDGQSILWKPTKPSDEELKETCGELAF